MPIERDGKILFAVKELAQTFAASEEMMMKHVEQGRLDGKEIDGEWYIPEESLREYFEQD